MTSSSPHLKPGTRLGPYEIVSLVGAGGMGEVYRARDTRLGRDVAIKVLPAVFASDPDRLRRFELEARAVAALSHPNILAIHDVGTHEGLPYIVAELLEGESLRERLEGEGLTIHKAVDIGIQIAKGLTAAHEKGIIHRDLKPSNVFLTKDDQVKLLDFGLAKLARPEPAPGGSTEASVLSTQTGAVMGTAGYMSPEQVRGLPADQRTDIFAFGCVLHEMLSGERPFRGDTTSDVMAAILKEDPAPLPARVPPALAGIVSRCLEKRPEGRFSSAHDLVMALQAASSQGELARFAVAGPRVTAPARRRRLLLNGGLLVVAAVAAALAIWQPWRAASKPVGSIPGHVPSILALPCKVYGAPEVAFLTDAVPGTISTLLAQVDGLDTKVPPTSFEVEKVKGDLARLAELYEVSSFIVTSITTSPGRFALNVQLVDTATRKVRWGKQYEGPRGAYNDLAHQAAEGIRQAVKPAAPPVPASGVSSEAELALWEGAYFLNRYNNLHHPSDFEASLAAFTRSLALDPAFAIAASKVAALYVYRFDVEGDAHEARKHAESWAHHALGIDPRCGEAWAALSMVELYATHADPERGIDYAVKAVAFAPRASSAHHTLGMWVASPGSVSLFVAASLRSVDLDPFLLPPAGNAAAGLCFLGRPAEALPVVDQALRVEPDFAWGLAARSLALLRLGRLQEAERTLRRCEAALSAAHTGGELWRQIRLALAVAQRDVATSEAIARQVLASALDARADANLVSNAALCAAPALAHMGRTDDAIRILQRSVEVGVPPAYDWLLLEPDFQPLRGDPRFAKVLVASRDGAAMVARILGQARTRGELPSYLNQPLDELVKLLNAKGGTS